MPATSNRSHYIAIIAVVLCLAASLISLKLLAKHVTGASGSTWFDAGCSDNAEQAGGVNCQAVLASPYAYWPPKQPDDPPGTLHTPVAFFGLMYFSSLTVWIAGIGRPSWRRRWVHAIPMFLIACGLLASARFVYVMFTVLDQWCPWCLATHVLNLLIALCVISLRPRRSDASPESSEPPIVETDARALHPSWTRIAGTIGIIMVVTYGNYGQQGLLVAHKVGTQLKMSRAALLRIQNDTTKLVKNWQLAATQPITLRDDDPVRTRTPSKGKTAELVVFSDFECPSCSRLAPFLEEQVQPMFDGRLKIVFKHYPLDQSCNEHTSRTLHPRACEAARIAEAARLQGGNEAFWKVHDLLFDRKRNHDADPASISDEVASSLGFDAAKLKRDMQSTEVENRIREDAAMGKKCGIGGTPAVFLARKRVDPLAVMDLAFWDQMAARFWHSAGTARPASTRPHNAKP